jgi:hypothetical protein
MENFYRSFTQSFDLWRGFLQRMPRWQSQTFEASLNTGKGAAIFWNGAAKYTPEFMEPSWNALSAFCDSERRKLPSTPFAQTIIEKNISWLICIAEKDDLVDEAASLAPLDWVDAEVTVFPKGHTAMATSWSMPTTECSLDACFKYGAHSSSTRPDGQCRGPVRYQLELDEALSKDG